METDGKSYSRLGPYVIVRTSGVGGMGRVDLALRTDGQPPEICVLKRMHGDARAPAQEARFEREARIAARLSHPNIAQSLRVEQIEGELCLAQEYVQGVDLARLMKQAGAGSIPAWAAAHIAREIAGALSYAHDFAGQEIVHRDVTPENIMLGFSGDVKLIDFGISRSGVDGTLTSIGMVVGRRAYLPPEVWSGSKPDRRADVFALGVVLWEMLTARRLEELDEALWKEKVPDPRTIREEISADLAAVAMRAFAPDPVARYQSADDFKEALAPFVPEDKDPRAELIAVLAFYFNVERAREILAGQIEDARKTLRRSQAGGKWSRSRSAWVALSAVGILLASGIAISGLRRSSPVSDATTERATLASPAPAAPPPTVPLAVRPTTIEQKPIQQAEGPPVGRSRDQLRHAAQQPAARSSAAPVFAEAVEKPDEILRKAYDLFDEGHLAEAQTRARRAIAVGAGARGHLLLGSIYMNRGKLADAEHELETAVRLDPKDTEAARRLSDVRRARLEQGQ